jgi:hypothetical protein
VRVVNAVAAAGPADVSCVSLFGVVGSDNAYVGWRFVLRDLLAENES